MVIKVFYLTLLDPLPHPTILSNLVDLYLHTIRPLYVLHAHDPLLHSVATTDELMDRLTGHSVDADGHSLAFSPYESLGSMCHSLSSVEGMLISR